MTTSLVVRLPVDEYRAHPIPFVNSDGARPKLGSCYVAVKEFPEELKSWMSVNPRSPALKKGADELKGPVASAIVKTLMEDPDMMCLKNNGITMLVEKAEFSKGSGGKGELTLTFANPKQHGVVNGGHTLAAIYQVADDADHPEPWTAMVRLHIYEGLEGEVIPGMAEGLNRSLQVDDKSLENLRGTFDKIRSVLNGKPGADKIAYRQGDQEPVDIQFILSLMATLNLDTYPDRKTFPNKIFGQPGKVLDMFAEDQGPNGKKVFDRMLPVLHEILVLSDEIQRYGVKHVGRLKVNGKGKNNRVASAGNKKREAVFAGGNIDGYFPVGWLLPMLSAFRSNISKEEWTKAKFKWIRPPADVLEATIDEMCDIIRQEHEDNKGLPAQVGKKESAYRGCYGVVMMELAD